MCMKERKHRLLATRLVFLISFQDPSDPPTDQNTIVFRLQRSCTRRPSPPDASQDPAELYEYHELLSSHLEFIPSGEQETVFVDKYPAPTNLGIVLAKLRPGQEVNMELHAVKGVGRDHAKFSPVGKIYHSDLPLFDYDICSYCFLSAATPHHTQPRKTCAASPQRKVSKMLFSWCDTY